MINPNLKYRITINGAEKAMQACNWCQEHISEDHWNINLPTFGKAIYTFQFEQPAQASTFALRWM